MQGRNSNKGEYQIPKLAISGDFRNSSAIHSRSWLLKQQGLWLWTRPPNIALQKIINLTQEDELANVTGLKRSLESKAFPLKGPFAGLFRYCAALQHTGLNDTSTEWWETESLSGGVGVIFLQQNIIIYHNRLSAAVKQNTHAAFRAKTETNFVLRIEKLSLQKHAVCPRAIKVSVCTNLPMVWMLSFLPPRLPAPTPSKDQRVRHVLTLNDAWPLVRGRARCRSV